MSILKEQLIHIENIINKIESIQNEEDEVYEITLLSGESFKTSGSAISLAENARFRTTLYTLKRMADHKRWLINTHSNEANSEDSYQKCAQVHYENDSFWKSRIQRVKSQFYFFCNSLRSFFQ